MGGLWQVSASATSRNRSARLSAHRFIADNVPYSAFRWAMEFPLFRSAICLLFSLSAANAAADPQFKVEVDTSKAPECAPFAEKAKKIAEEWYPKINEIIFGKDRALPGGTIHLWFEPMDGVAHATHDGIHISAEWVTKKAPDDYGMVVHELTHVVQDYKGKGEFWLTEGIADYVRYERYEPGKQKWKIDPDKSSYKQGYGIAGAFLGWLETTKDRELVRKLNTACHDGSYNAKMFTELCGADVDSLWKEYVQSKLRAGDAAK